MNPRSILLFVVLPALLAGAAPAQSFGYVFSTSQTETTLSGSAGTVLQTLRPNEVAAVEFVPCPVTSAEKWAPRTCYNTMAGDDDNNGLYFNPAMFGSIDALCDIVSPIACASQRTVFWSPSVALGTNVSGGPGLRPGDTGRIVRIGALDGQVEYFLRAEDVQIALGMPPTPVVVDVDAIAADPGYGVFFSVDSTHAVSTACGVTQVLDGDLLMIPSSAITWTFDLRVASVVAGQAEVVYTEAQMDAIVASAGIADRFGACVTLIQDLEALDIDYSGPITSFVTCNGTPLSVPALVFSGELMTGAGLCTTASGGQIHTGGCGRLGSACGSGLATLGDQMGLNPPSTTVGVPSWVNALASTFIERFVLEPVQHVLTAPTTVTIHTHSPHPANVVFVKIAPPVVAPSLPFFNCGFPDVYFFPAAWWTFPLTGFASFTTPAINVPVKLVWQGVALTSGGNLVLSAPASVDIQ
jgi:hypothetical protein